MTTTHIVTDKHALKNAFVHVGQLIKSSVAHLFIDFVNGGVNRTRVRELGRTVGA